MTTAVAPVTLTTRLLPPDEWPKLVGTELEPLWPNLDREAARIIVVEQGDRIVGAWSLFPLVHLEGLWIAPEHRKHAAVSRALLRGMVTTARAMNARVLQVTVLDDAIRMMLLRLGAVDWPGRYMALAVPPDEGR